ncbi:hypothetical protein [Streptomyces cinereospinus]|uniref:Uncharacterized protein n=1 Tax=Streptomyces cinereospinus TaxID=285561 RepID=A0ABV5N4P4_9ACTN
MLTRIATYVRRLASGALTLLLAATAGLAATPPAHAAPTSTFTPGRPWTDTSGRALQMAPES